MLTWFSSLAPGRFKWNFGSVIFKLTLMTAGWVISCEIPLSRMSLNLTDDKSTLVQVMAWCRQATSHYLSQCWPRSMPPYGVTRPQWAAWISNHMARTVISPHLDSWCDYLFMLGLKLFHVSGKGPCFIIVHLQRSWRGYRNGLVRVCPSVRPKVTFWEFRAIQINR